MPTDVTYARNTESGCKLYTIFVDKHVTSIFYFLEAHHSNLYILRYRVSGVKSLVFKCCSMRILTYGTSVW